ncbi:MAG: ABC transporter substrate-binding protein [Clostridiales bacterium]|nr:ABC transporter substrate-binding protein [Clostridiales bacterium]
MKKLTSILLASLLILSVLSGLAEAPPPPLRVGALKGPTAMGLVKLMKDDEGKNGYAFTLAASPDALVPELVRGNLDLACVPVNLAAILYANTKGAIQVVNINTKGVLYIVERGETVKSLADLKGRTIYASGKASTPEYALNHLLSEAGVEANLEWKAEHAEALAALMADEKGLALLPQPFVTVAQSKSQDIRMALDLNAQWKEQFDSELITGVTVARKEVIKQDAERLANFLTDYEASITYVNENVPEAAALIGEFDIFNAQVAEKALPHCSIAFVKGEEMKALLVPFYQMLFEQNPQATGGSLPDDGFYYLP